MLNLELPDLTLRQGREVIPRFVGLSP